MTKSEFFGQNEVIWPLKPILRVVDLNLEGMNAKIVFFSYTKSSLTKVTLDQKSH